MASDSNNVGGPEGATSPANDAKVCPRCAETVKAKALVCRFCGYDFEKKTTPLASNVARPARPKKPRLGCGVIFGVLVLLGMIAAMIGPFRNFYDA